MVVLLLLILAVSAAAAAASAASVAVSVSVAVAAVLMVVMNVAVGRPAMDAGALAVPGPPSASLSPEREDWRTWRRRWDRDRTGPHIRCSSPPNPGRLERSGLAHWA